MRKAITVVVGLLFLLPVSVPAQETAELGIRLLAIMFDSLDSFVEGAEARWEADLSGRLQVRQGTAMSPEEIRLPLSRASRRIEGLRQRWNEERGDTDSWTPEQEDIAFEIAEIHWNLVVEEANRYVAALRREIGGTQSCSGYEQTARRLLEQRRQFADTVFQWIEFAKLEERDLAWETWADFADGSLNVTDGTGIATQLDDFLKAAVVIQYGETTRERIECDMSSQFAELAIDYPGDEYPPPEYPNHEWERFPKIYTVLGLEQDKARTKDGRNELQLQLFLTADEETPATHPSTFDMRIFSVVGRNFASAPGWIGLESDSEWIDYEIFAIRPKDGSDLASNRQRNDLLDSWTNKLLAQEQVDPDTQTYLGMLDRVGVVAYPRPGAMPGEYSFRLNGIEIKWTYGRSPDLPAAIGALRVVRALPDGGFVPVTSIFSADHLAFEIELDRDTNADKLDLSLGSWRPDSDVIDGIEVDGASGIDLLPAPDNSRVFRSKTYRLPVDAPFLASPDPEETINIELGSHLLASLPTSTPILHAPLVAPLVGSPVLIGRDWQQYLALANRSAREAGVAISPNTSTSMPVREISAGGILGANVEISLGDHAAMLLLHNELIYQLKSERIAMNAFLDDVDRNDELARDWVENKLTNDARAGILSVTTLPLNSNSIAEGTLGEALGNLSRTAERRDAELLAIARAVSESTRSSMTAALLRLEAVDTGDLRALMGALGSSASPWNKILPPDLVRSQIIDNEQWWIPESPARAQLASIDQKLQELPAADKLAEAQQDVAFAIAGTVAAGSGLLRSLAMRGHFWHWSWSASTASSSAEFFSATALAFEALGALDIAERKIPQYFEQRAEVRFARGLQGIVAHERFDEALANQKPGWMLLAEMAAGGIGLGVEMREVARGFRLSARNIAPVGDALVQDISDALAMIEKDGLDGFNSLSGTQRAKLLALEVLIRDAPGATQTLRFGASIRQRLRMAIEALEDEVELKKAQRWLDSEWFAHARIDRSVATLGGTGPLALPPGVGQRPLPFDSDVPVMRDVVLGNQLGEGRSSTVFEIENSPLIVAKVAKLRPRTEWTEGIDEVEGALSDIDRSLRFSELLTDAEIPHLQVLGKGQDGDIVFALQQRLPHDARTISVQDAQLKRAMVDNNTVPADFSLTATLPKAYQHAILRLYKKLADAGIVWEDSHLENLFFFRDGMHWEAGILDLDRMFVFREGADGMGEAWEFLLDIARGHHQSNVRSMDNVPTPGYAQLIADKDSMMDQLIDADFSMQKMLEHKFYIAYDSAADQWTGTYLDLNIVERYFPNFRAHLGPGIPELRAERAANGPTR